MSVDGKRDKKHKFLTKKEKNRGKTQKKGENRKKAENYKKYRNLILTRYWKMLKTETRFRRGFGNSENRNENKNKVLSNVTI